MEKRKREHIDGFDVQVINASINSTKLKREVKVDFYISPGLNIGEPVSLLLINDGQDLPVMDFPAIVQQVYNMHELRPMLAVGIHAGKDRKNEYGTARKKDFKNRGAKAPDYTAFIFEELIPFIRMESGIVAFREKIFAGFSLGGLMAMDIVWGYPYEFSKLGVFSGSFWWRSVGLDDGYVEDTDRIMHSLVRQGNFAPWLKFYFQTGALDETADRNNNGIIDSIDDTLGLIAELKRKGYTDNDIRYVELADGRHDVPTWGRAMPDFLLWALNSEE
jgi:enterochelin esterase-like enzyme